MSLSDHIIRKVEKSNDFEMVIDVIRENPDFTFKQVINELKGVKEDLLCELGHPMKNLLDEGDRLNRHRRIDTGRSVARVTKIKAANITMSDNKPALAVIGVVQLIGHPKFVDDILSQKEPGFTFGLRAVVNIDSITSICSNAEQPVREMRELQLITWDVIDDHAGNYRSHDDIKAVVDLIKRR